MFPTNQHSDRVEDTLAATEYGAAGTAALTSEARPAA